jgi:hypothetical protein
MRALNDAQLAIITQAAATVEPTRRDEFLQRCASMLKVRYRFDDRDVAQVAQLALSGLVHELGYEARGS